MPKLFSSCGAVKAGVTWAQGLGIVGKEETLSRTKDCELKLECSSSCQFLGGCERIMGKKQKYIKVG